MINQVIQGDCLSVMKDIPDKIIDMVLTSPPYDNLRDYKGYTFNFEGIAKEIFRVLKDGGVCVWVVGDATIKGSETGTSFKQALYFKEIGFNLHDTMIYQKTGFANPSSNRYHQTFEYMFILSKGSPQKFNPIKDRKNNYERRGGGTRRLKSGEMQSGTGYQILGKYGQRFNIWKIPHQNNNERLHPASFPEKLAEDHILSWSNEGDTILDPMAGSGTTLKMAMKNNRNYIGIEISPEYIDIINKRLNETPDKLL